MATDGVPQQLSLSVSLSDHTTFANFYAEPSNLPLLAALRQFSAAGGESNLVVWGASGSGLTHLLQACCHSAFKSGVSIQYLPLAELKGYAPEQIFEGLETFELVCLDDLEVIAGDAVWERALFHVYNRLRDGGRRLLIASHIAPVSLSFCLPDLRSRLLGSVVFHAHHLSDEGKAEALKRRAKDRGMTMSDEILRFVLARAPRDTHGLFDLLDLLDRTSLQQQRRLTIPFIKSVLNI